MKGEYFKTTAFSYLHTDQLLIFLNLKVMFTANKEVTRNHCLKKYFVQQVSKTYPKGICKWISTAVSLL